MIFIQFYVYDLLDKLPNGIQTKIGAEGMGLSQGQKQRILIARAVYKDPQYLFFDEETVYSASHTVIPSPIVPPSSLRLY